MVFNSFILTYMFLKRFCVIDTKSTLSYEQISTFHL